MTPSAKQEVATMALCDALQALTAAQPRSPQPKAWDRHNAAIASIRAVLTDERATPSNPGSGAVQVKVERNRVWIVSGVQSFMLAYEADTEAELEWYASMLRDALAGRPSGPNCRWPMCESKAVQDQSGIDAVEALFGAHPAPKSSATRNAALEAAAQCLERNIHLLTIKEHAARIRALKTDDAEPCKSAAHMGEHAKRAEGDPLIALMSEYWDIAYQEGREGVNLSERANDVLARFRAALGQHQVGVPDGWQIAPKVPTFAMVHAAANGKGRSTGAHMESQEIIYADMLAAAPTAPEATP